MDGIVIWEKFGYVKKKKYDDWMHSWIFYIEGQHVNPCEESDQRFETVDNGVFDFEEGKWVVPNKYDSVDIIRRSYNDFSALVYLFRAGSMSDVKIEANMLVCRVAENLYGVFHNQRLVLPVCETLYRFVNSYIIRANSVIYSYTGECICEDVLEVEKLIDAVDGYVRYSILCDDFRGNEYYEDYQYAKMSSKWTIVVNKNYEFAIFEKDKRLTDYVFTNIRLLNDFDHLLVYTTNEKFGLFSLKNGWIFAPNCDSINCIGKHHLHVNGVGIFTYDGKSIIQDVELKPIGSFHKLGNVLVFKKSNGQYFLFDDESGSVTEVSDSVYLEMFKNVELRGISISYKNYKSCTFKKKYKYIKDDPSVEHNDGD